jgi:hypothetical protein
MSDMMQIRLVAVDMLRKHGNLQAAKKAASQIRGEWFDRMSKPQGKTAKERCEDRQQCWEMFQGYSDVAQELWRMEDQSHADAVLAQLGGY